MKTTLIYGDTGSGKTKRIEELIAGDVENQRPCMLLVPDQAEWSTEEELLKKLPDNAGRFLEIRSLSSLCRSVISRFACESGKHFREDLQLPLLWCVIRSESGNLHIYNNRDSIGFSLCNQMMDSMLDFRHFGTTKKAGDYVFPESRRHISDKVSDLLLITSAYNRLLEEKCGRNPQDRFEFVENLLKKNTPYGDFNIYVDGFTGFTKSQRGLIHSLQKQAKNFTIALTTTTLKDPVPGHFLSITRTARRFLEFDKDAVTVEMKKDYGETSLDLLKKHLFDDAEIENTPDTDNIHLFTCSGIYMECEKIAQEIEKLKENGTDYGKIAVLVRSAENYRGILDRVLYKHGIPYFLSVRFPIRQSSFYTFLRHSLLYTIYGRQREDVIALLKTGLLPLTEKEVACFESYTDTWNLRGEKLSEPFIYNPDGYAPEISERGQEILNSAKKVQETIMPHLDYLYTDCKTCKTPKEFCSALYRYLQRVGMNELLKRQAEENVKKGNLRQAKETLRLYKAVVNALCSIAGTLPEENMDTAEFYRLFDLILANLDFGETPEEGNCVLIGEAGTTRASASDYVFLPGMIEGQYPKIQNGRGIFTEKDLEFLISEELLSKETTDSRYGDELFTIYSAISSARKGVFLSYAQNPGSEAPPQPSSVYQRVKKLFGLHEEVVNMPIQPPVSFLSKTPEKLKKKPKELRLSQSKIQKFQRCPYQYYLDRCHFRDKKTAQMNVANDGSFLHYLFENYLKASVTDKGIICPPDSEAFLQNLTMTYFEEELGLPKKALHGSLLHTFSRLNEVGTAMLNSIVRELEASSFVPVAYEKNLEEVSREFGVDPFEITLADGTKITMSGIIDRIDLCKQGDDLYIRITDYKSGKHTFKPEDVATGEDLQLVLYLFAVCRQTGKYKPYGAQYLYQKKDKDGVTVQASGFGLEGFQTSEAEVSGIKYVDIETIRSYGQMMEEAVQALGTQIAEGRVERTPSDDSCQYCVAKDTCILAKFKEWE